MTYEVYERETGALIASGSGAECAEQMGRKLSGFYALACNTERRQSGKYIIEKKRKPGRASRRQAPATVVCEICGETVARTLPGQRLCPDCREAKNRKWAEPGKKAKKKEETDTHELLRMAAQIQQTRGKSYGDLVREAEARKIPLEKYMREVLANGD